jgi:hypothetical protein
MEEKIEKKNGKHYCSHCLHYRHQVHPFYHDEIIEVCFSNPKIIGDHVNPKLRFDIPKEKNKNNECEEHKLTFKHKIRNFLNKIF